MNNRSDKALSLKNWQPVEWLLAVLFLLAPLYYHPNLGGEGLRIPNNITAWLVAIIVIFYAFYLILKRKEIEIPKYFFFIFSFPILATLSGFVTGVEQPLKWAFKLLFIWGGAFFFLSLYQYRLSESVKDRLIFIIVLSGLMHAVVGILQFILKSGMILWIPVYDSGFPTSLFWQINNHATYQVTIILLSFYLLTRPLFTESDRRTKIILLVTVTSSAFIVLASGSRVGILSLIIAFPTLVFLLKNTYRKNYKIFAIFTLALCIGGVIGAVNGGAARFEDKVQAMESGYSGNARLSIYEISWELIKQSPLVGHGLGSFTPKWQFEKKDFHEQNPDKQLIEQYVTHPHNELIMWMVEGGVVAVAGIFILFVVSIVVAYKIKRLYMLALLFPVVLHTQLELPFYTSAIHWFLFLFLLYLLFENTQKKVLQSSSAMTLTLKVSWGLVGGLTLVFLVHSLKANFEVSRQHETNAGLELASQNPYFANTATRIYMSKLYDYSVRQHDVNNLNVFIDWMKDEVQVVPNPTSFILLTHAYQLSGQTLQACRTTELGIGIYPKNEALKAFESNCIK